MYLVSKVLIGCVTIELEAKPLMCTCETWRIHSYICMTWLIHTYMWDMTHWNKIIHDPFICSCETRRIHTNTWVTWLMHTYIWDMTHWCHVLYVHIHMMWVMTHVWMGHDPFICTCETWRIHTNTCMAGLSRMYMWDTTHWNKVIPDPFIRTYETWHIQYTHTRMAWLNHMYMWDMTRFTHLLRLDIFGLKITQRSVHVFSGY